MARWKSATASSWRPARAARRPSPSAETGAAAECAAKRVVGAARWPPACPASNNASASRARAGSRARRRRHGPLEALGCLGMAPHPLQHHPSRYSQSAISGASDSRAGRPRAPSPIAPTPAASCPAPPARRGVVRMGLGKVDRALNRRAGVSGNVSSTTDGRAGSGARGGWFAPPRLAAGDSSATHRNTSGKPSGRPADHHVSRILAGPPRPDLSCESGLSRDLARERTDERPGGRRPPPGRCR